MLRTILKKVFRIGLGMAVLTLLILAVPRLATDLVLDRNLYPEDGVPQKSVAIVFGAGLRRDGSPTAVLRDRVEKAVDLYFSGKVDYLLLSGDNSQPDYDEPTAMMEYARRLGVPENALVRDFAGRRTYDTCFRAQAIFGVEDAILVTQEYHLPRALYTCQAIGIDVVGVAADTSRYWRGALTFWKIREIPATLVAFLDVHILRPLPVLGMPEPIL